MENINIAYIRSHFLTLEEIAKESGLTEDMIGNAIKGKALPEASYEIVETLSVKSPLNDEYSAEQTTAFFPKSYINLIRDYKDGPKPNRRFLDELSAFLCDHDDREYAYKGAVGSKTELESALEAELNAYKAGIYGICTTNGDSNAIIEKKIAVKKLIDFCNRTDEPFTPAQVEELIALVAAYDRVSRLFAPYQREKSSRGNYVDALLRKAGREDLIKQYS